MSPFHDDVTPLVTRRDVAPLHAIQGTLALDLGPEPAPPLVPAAPVLAGADTVPVAPAVRRELQRWALMFVQACVEVVLGDRPASQLVRLTTPELHREIAYRAAVVARAGVQATARGRRPPVRPQVANLHTCFVSERVVEMSVRVKYGERSRALAGRLEVVDGRWQCTQLEFG